MQKRILMSSISCLLAVIVCFCSGCKATDPLNKYAEIQTPCEGIYWCMSKEELKALSIGVISDEDEESIEVYGVKGLPDCAFLDNYLFDSSSTKYEFYDDKLCAIEYIFDNSEPIYYDLIDKYLVDDIDKSLYNKIAEELDGKYSNRYDYSFDDMEDALTSVGIEYTSTDWTINDAGNTVSIWLSERKTSQSLRLKYYNYDLDSTIRAEKYK